ncbi:arylesterase [Agarivorans sp. Alg241-V36]|uniref:arylesterase n=1 Tax=Agarivorans sp. Alg241-V36 TaxID=2305992 RepID=UPI001967B580|nr:arylesterase [Agarivorans sp. Alg241-V36]
MMVRHKNKVLTLLTLSVLLFFTLSSKAFANTKSILILGDSLSAGYGMPIEQAWVSLTQQYYNETEQAIDLINASISGETTAGGLRRLPSLIQEHKIDWLLIELGGNDGLQGHPTTNIENNLNAIIALAKQNDIKIALMQIRIPPNYGKRYRQAFEGLYPKIAEQQQVSYLPFFIEDIATNSSLMQNDGIHPNQQAQPLISQKMREQLKELIKAG